MTHTAFTNPREVSGVELLLTAQEARHYLSNHRLPPLFRERVDAFVRLAICTNCDDMLDMNVVFRHHDTNPDWCAACCDASGNSAFARYVGHPPRPGDVRVYFAPDRSWKREDPLTLAEAYDYLVNEVLPHDFEESVRVTAEFGLDSADEDALGSVNLV
jgi:hypothetical protein